MRKLSFFALLLLWSCENGDNSKATHTNQLSSTKIQSLPNTPENVVRTWETKVAETDFTYAKRLSTNGALAYVNSLSDTKKEQDIEPMNIKFEKIECNERGNTAECNCILQYNNSDKAAFQYQLIYQNGQWLVNTVTAVDVVSSINL